MENFKKLIETIEQSSDTQSEKLIKNIINAGFSREFYLFIKANFNSFSPNIKKTVFKIFMAWKSPEPVEFLISIYKNEKNFHKKLTILNVIKKLPVKNYTLEIKRLLDNEESHELKIHIINLLGLTENKNAYKYLIEFLKSEDIDIKAATFINCLKLDFREALSYTFKILEKGPRQNRIDLLNLLSIINTEQIQLEFTEFLEKRIKSYSEDKELYKYLLQALINFKSKKVLSEILNNLKKNKFTRTCENLILELKKFEYNNSLESFLINLLKLKPENQVLKNLLELIYYFSKTEEIASRYLFLIHSDNSNSINLAVKLIIKFKLLNKEYENILSDLIKKETDDDFFSYIFICLCSKNTHNNQKIIKLRSYFEKFPFELKYKVITKFEKLEKNHFASNVLFFFFHREEDEKVRATIASILGTVATNNSLELFKAILKDENARVRANAIESIEKACGYTEKVVELIMPFLKDYNNRVKANVAIALWQKGGLRMLQLLEKMLLNHPDKWHRASAAYALFSVKNPSTLDTLYKCLEKEKDQHVISNCVKAIGVTGDENSAALLIDMYKNQSSLVKERIIESLGFLNYRISVDFLFEKLSENNPETADLCQNSLINLGSINDEILKRKLLKFKNDKNLLKRICKIIAETGSIAQVDTLKNLKQELDNSSKKFISDTINKLKT
ncbi:MAG: HEAT repeat domain-containing protein [Candidatus Muiribacteriota bacterium]